MTFWVDAAWVLGGALIGTPISAAMSSLPATEGAGVSLKSAREYARGVTDWRVWAWFRATFGSNQPKAPPSDDNVWGGLFLALAGVYIVVRLYVENVVTVAVVLFWLSALALVITATVFLVLWWRRVFDGRGTSWALLSTVPFAAMGTIVSYWLIEPPLNGVLEPALSALEMEGIAGLTPYLGPLVLQILGALASFILLLSSMALCGANVGAALIASEAWGSRWLWRFVFWVGRWSTGPGAFIGFAVLAVLALFSASGLAAEWIADVQDTLRQTIPSPLP